MYIDKDADPEMAVKIAINAKTQRPGVCNAIETLIVHEDVLPMVREKLVSEFRAKETEVRADETFRRGLTDKPIMRTAE